jgi:hypothetical protein
MDIKAAGNCGTDGSPSIAYATLPSTLSSDMWVMRFKLVFNTVTAESTGGKSFFTNFFLVDNGAVWDTSENGFGFRFIADAGSTQTQFYSMTSGTASGTTMSWTPSSGSTIYVEISYSSGTATANFYSDSGYSSRVGSTTANATRTGTFSGLKFPQIALRQDTGGNGVMEIDMSELKIYDGVNGGDAKLGTGAYSLNGTSSHVTVGSTSDWNFVHDGSGATVSAWVYRNGSQTGNGGIFVTEGGQSTTTGFGLGIRSGGNAYARTINTSNSWQVCEDTSSSVSTGVWHHILATIDSTSIKLYVDGTLNSSHTISGTLKSGNSSYRAVGRAYSGSAWSYLNGNLDDMGIWKRVLTATEISTLSGVLSGTPRTSYNNLQSDSRNIAGTQFLTGHKLIGESVTKVKMRFKNLHSLSGGTITCKILNNDKSVKTTFSSISTGDIDSSTYEEFTFTGSATTIAVNDIICAEITNSASNDIEMGYSGAEANAQVVEKTSGSWSSSTSNSITYKVVESDGALVSSLSDKSNLKAYYSMDTVTTINGSPIMNILAYSGATNFIHVGDSYKTRGEKINASDSALVGYKVSSVTVTIKDYDGNGLTGNLTCTILDSSGNAVSGDSFAPYNTAGLTSTESDVTFTNSNPTRVLQDDDSIALYYNGDATHKVGFKRSDGGDAFDGTKTCRAYRTGTSGALGVEDTEDQIMKIVPSVDGCVNDFSSTSALDGVTGVRTNSIFQQTDVPEYYWYNGTSWLRDGSPPLGNNLHAWYDASDSSSVTKDSSNLVSQLNDKSGNGYNLTASGTGTGGQPLWVSGGKNDLDIVDFGSSKQMKAQWTAKSQPVTYVAFMYSPASDGSQDNFWDNYDNTNSSMGFANVDTSNNLSAYAPTNLGSISSTNYTQKWGLFTVIYNTTSSEILINGDQKASGDIGTNSSYGITLSCHRTSATYGQIKLAEMLIYDKVLSSDELTTINNYFVNKWGAVLE